MNTIKQVLEMIIKIFNKLALFFDSKPKTHSWKFHFSAQAVFEIGQIGFGVSDVYKCCNCRMYITKNFSGKWERCEAFVGIWSIIYDEEVRDCEQEKLLCAMDEALE